MIHKLWKLHEQKTTYIWWVPFHTDNEMTWLEVILNLIVILTEIHERSFQTQEIIGPYKPQLMTIC